MNCFMLRKCLDLMKNGDGIDANVRVNCTCCGGIVRENAINNKEEEAKEEDDEVTTKEEISKVTAKQGEAVERDLLQPCSLCLLYTSPSPRDGLLSRMPSSA